MNKITECNCDLPLFAYIDWLQEQGWETTEEELEFHPLQSDWCASAYWKEFGIPWNASCNWGIGYDDEDYYGIEYFRINGSYVVGYGDGLFLLYSYI
jgi:hypothetical protein